MLTQWGQGCTCDCCIVYKSQFCKNWYESVYERKYFGSVTGNPSRMNLNGGSFDQLGAFTEEDYKVWEIRNDTCGADDTFCEADTDPKGYRYSQYHYLTPTNNLAGSYLSTLAIADKFQWWMYTFWNTCDSSLGSPCWDSANNQPASNQIIIFLFDYKDKNNWTGLQVEYKPDFNTSPSAVTRLFEAKIRQQVNGSVSLIGQPFEIDLGLGDKKIEVGIEINVDERAACGDSAFAFIKFGSKVFNLTYDSVGGDRIGIVQSLPSGVVESLNCGGTDYTISEGFGIYTWVHQYLDSEKTGCPTYSVPQGCCGDCPNPEFDISFSGFTNGDCDICEDFNNTYTLKYFGKLTEPDYLVPLDDPFDTWFSPFSTVGDFQWFMSEEIPTNATEACWWFYEFDQYSTLHCHLDVTTTGIISSTTPLNILGFALCKFKIGTGLTAYSIWRLYVAFDLRLSVHLETVTDPDGNPVHRGYTQLLKDGWHYSHTTSAADIDKCIFDGSESWTPDNWSFDLTGLHSTVNPLELGDFCDSLGTLSIENG